jgi:aminoglycoside phosphotransferase (APT) family kinase protein
MDIRHNSLPDSAALALLNEILPGSSLCSIRPVDGDFYNRQFYLDASPPQEAALPAEAPYPADAAPPSDADTKEGDQLHFVVKLYQGERNFCVRRARVEYQVLRWLHLHHGPQLRSGCRTPEPVFLDDTGTLLGSPVLVTRCLPGSPILDPPYPPDWGQQMALALAGIHAHPCDASAQVFLLDKNPEKLWWRRSGSIPAWMAADPDGQLIWDAFTRQLSRQEKTPPRLCHADFWSGNVLCLDGKITAVVDWEEAGYGDPGSDAAYCYMNLLLSGLDQAAAEEFLSTYQSVTGNPVANLTLWKLAAAVRPIYLPEGWIDQSPVRERFRRYVQETLQEENLLETR